MICIEAKIIIITYDIKMKIDNNIKIKMKIDNNIKINNNINIKKSTN